MTDAEIDKIVARITKTMFPDQEYDIGDTVYCTRLGKKSFIYKTDIYYKNPHHKEYLVFENYIINQTHLILARMVLTEKMVSNFINKNPYV